MNVCIFESSRRQMRSATYHAADELENHHRFSSWIPFHPLLCEGQGELDWVKMQLFKINATGVSGVDELFDLLGLIAIRPREFAPHAGSEIRQPVRVVGTGVIVRTIKDRFDEMGDALSSSRTAKPKESVNNLFNPQSSNPVYVPAIQENVDLEQANGCVSEDERVAVLLQTTNGRHVQQRFRAVQTRAEDLAK